MTDANTEINPLHFVSDSANFGGYQDPDKSGNLDSNPGSVLIERHDYGVGGGMLSPSASSSISQLYNLS